MKFDIGECSVGPPGGVGGSGETYLATTNCKGAPATGTYLTAELHLWEIGYWPVRG
jgi:hypothetical protein